MRISDWSSDVCSSDLRVFPGAMHELGTAPVRQAERRRIQHDSRQQFVERDTGLHGAGDEIAQRRAARAALACQLDARLQCQDAQRSSEEHTSELQSLMRNSYADFSMQKKSTHKLAIHCDI